ncbi:Vacuolar ATPase assembly integral membrane protein vma21 [Golovinomyces cichoracearum]|uniref:Vacuolar ATPase assembly integral membrane protein vma21 n=1 Tax=Golovinomyces cichoracearum TaxID=62708 RepID=A0A420JAW3_9PEZI|nr:Vacuolar ATPase assembly integral membrane protein vma21 [Golovinomyces cichoracearum]
MINSGPEQKNANIQQIKGEKESRSNNDSLQSGQLNLLLLFNSQIPCCTKRKVELIYPSPYSHVIFKLLGFTLAMVVGPIGCYFATLNKIFGGQSNLSAPWRKTKVYIGNSTYAGTTAAIVANLILAGYIIVAFREDLGEVSETKEEKKKK